VPFFLGGSTSTSSARFQRNSLFGKVVASRVEVRRGREWASIATSAYVASRRFRRGQAAVGSGAGRAGSYPRHSGAAVTPHEGEFRSPAIWRRYSSVVASRSASRSAIRTSKGLVLLPQRLEEVVPSPATWTLASYPLL
jgi:hypothetical protein